MFVAGRHLRIERDGEIVDVGPGDPVPEAGSWSHDTLLRCMKVGQIVNVDRTDAADSDNVALLGEQHATKQATKAKNAKAQIKKRAS